MSSTLPAPHRKNPLLSCAALFGFAIAASGPSAMATTVVEDFTYANGPLLLRNGGSGWSSVWGPSTGTGQNTSRILADQTVNLTLASGSGYDVTQTGTGLAYGNFSSFRGINRTLDVNLTGTIWFSVLVNNGQSDDRAGIQFNNHEDSPFALTDYNQGAFHAEVAGSDLLVRYNGVTSASVATLALGQTHLLLGRLILGAGNDTFDLWADPANVLNPGTPLFTANTADMETLGSGLFLAGIFSYGNSDLGPTPGARHGMIDALRISDGNGNADAALQAVVVPEPSVVGLLMLAGVALNGRRRRMNEVSR